MSSMSTETYCDYCGRTISTDNATSVHIKNTDFCNDMCHDGYVYQYTSGEIV